MKKKIFFLTALSLIVIISIPVSAKITTSYLYISAGVSQLAKEIQIPGMNDLWKVKTDTKAGLYLSCGGGYYELWGRFRLEYDISYRKNSIVDIEIIKMDVVGVSIVGGQGKVTSLSFMLHGWYDVDITGNWAVYFGGGLGAGRISLKDFYIETAPVVPDPIISKILYVNNSDWRFAMQAGAGITFALNADFLLDLGYRYYLTSNPHFVTEMDYEFTADMQSHVVLISLKFLH